MVLAHPAHLDSDHHPIKKIALNIFHHHLQLQPDQPYHVTQGNKCPQMVELVSIVLIILELKTSIKCVLLIHVFQMKSLWLTVHVQDVQQIQNQVVIKEAA